MDLQLELTAAAPATDANVEWLEQLLLERAAWLTAAEIAAASLGRLNERAVRKLASDSQWILSGPGSPGYKHLKCATADEVNHFTNAAQSQGQLMIERSLRLRRTAHAIFG
jgi:hypothetical protein